MFLKKIKEFIRKNSSSGPRENCLKHREYCFTLLEDSCGESFGEWIIDLDGLCIWRWYEVRSKYLQNSFVYLSSRHVAGFWRLVLSSSWIASCFRNHCSHAQTVYRHLKYYQERIRGRSVQLPYNRVYYRSLKSAAVRCCYSELGPFFALCSSLLPAFTSIHASSYSFPTKTSER